MVRRRFVGIISVLALLLLAAPPAGADPLLADGGQVRGTMDLGEDGYCNDDGTAQVTSSDGLVNYDRGAIFSWQDLYVESAQFGVGRLYMCGWMTELDDWGGCQFTKGMNGRGRMIFPGPEYWDLSDDVILYISDFGWEVNADVYYVGSGSIATTRDKAANSEGGTLNMVFRRWDTPERCLSYNELMAGWTVTLAPHVNPNSLPGI